MPDILEKTEGVEDLAKLASQGAPAKKRKGKPGDLKAGWEKVNVRMDPGIKNRLKTKAKTLDVPAEELVHVALSRFLDALDEGEIKLSFKPVTTRQTIL